MCKDMISIIIPVFNTEKYVRECLESVLNQTISNYEIICIDDSSEDKSLQIVNEYMMSDSRIRLIENKTNKGLSAVRNCGIRNAKGKYILFLDSDDLMREDALEMISDRAELYGADIVQFDYHHLFEEGVNVWYREPKGNYHGLEGVYSGKEFFIELITNHIFEGQVCFRLFRRDFLLENGLFFYEGILHEDYLFSFLCFMSAQKVVCCDQDLYTYRKHPKGITNRKDLARSSSYFISFLEVWKYWTSTIHSVELDKSITVLARYLFDMYLEYIGSNDMSADLPFRNQADKWLYDHISSILMPKHEYIHLNEEIINIINRNGKIYIYGAGNYGGELYDKLAEKGIFVESFIVSDRESNGKLCKGRYIIPIDYLHIEDDALIIVAVSPSKTGEIVEQLRGRGYRNYLLLNDREDADTVDYWNEPINSRKILFFSYGSGGQYADHGKYITEALIRQCKDFDVVWALKNTESTMSDGVRTIPAYDRVAVCKESATAAVWISNDPLPTYLIKREGQIYIQTKHWASITLKRFYLDDSSFNGVGDYYDRWRQGLNEMDYCLVGSQFDEESCRHGFEFEGECVHVGSPRSDAMFHEDENKEKVYSYYHVPRNHKIVMYAPTFRYKDGTRESIRPEFRMDYDGLIDVLKGKYRGEWSVFVRMHPQIGGEPERYANSYVVDVSDYMDSQELVSAVDILISDYSSIMFEPAFVGKPVFLFAPDYLDYVGKKKELLIDYDSLPFPRAVSMEQLLDKISEFDIEQYERDVKAFLEKYDVREDGHASEKAAVFIMKVVQEREKSEREELKSDLLAFCNKQSKIYLYGAGNYGKTAGIFLKNIGYDIAGYITTEKSDVRQFLEIPIKSVQEWGDDLKKAGVLICVGKKYFGEVSRVLDIISCKDIFRIQQKLYQEMVDINHTASPFQPVITNPKNKVISLYYHRVTNLTSDPWSMAITPEEFEHHLKYLSGNFRIVGFEDDWSDIEDKAITISFDDGYHDFYSNALPLLEKYQVPATIFISTANIDTNREFWWDRLERLLWHSSKVPEIIHVGKEKISTVGDEALKKALSSVRLVLKESYTMKERERFLDELEMRCEGTIEPDMPAGRTLTTEEIKMLSKSDFVTIGSHTRTHAALAFADENEQREEIGESIKTLEKITGKKIRTFSYPYGSYNDSASGILDKYGIIRSRTIVEDIVKTDTEPLLTPGINAGPLKMEELAQRIANLWNDRGNE